MCFFPQGGHRPAIKNQLWNWNHPNLNVFGACRDSSESLSSWVSSCCWVLISTRLHSYLTSTSSNIYESMRPDCLSKWTLVDWKFWQRISQRGGEKFGHNFEHKFVPQQSRRAMTMAASNSVANGARYPSQENNTCPSVTPNKVLVLWPEDEQKHDRHTKYFDFGLPGFRVLGFRVFGFWFPGFWAVRLNISNKNALRRGLSMSKDAQGGSVTGEHLICSGHFY